MCIHPRGLLKKDNYNRNFEMEVNTTPCFRSCAVSTHPLTSDTTHHKNKYSCSNGPKLTSLHQLTSFVLFHLSPPSQALAPHPPHLPLSDPRILAPSPSPLTQFVPLSHSPTLRPFAPALAEQQMHLLVFVCSEAVANSVSVPIWEF